MKAKFDPCPCCKQELRVECPLCGNSVRTICGKYASHERSFCTGSHFEHKTCPMSEKEV